MADLDRLEQLNRLREAGALTGDEFEREKVRLLAAKGLKPLQKWYPLVAALLVAGAAALAFFLLPLLQRNKEAAMTTSSVEAGSVAQRPGSSAASNEQFSDDKTSRNLLAFATSEEVIGLNPAYLEKKFGIPREKGITDLTFDVGGCRISYGFEKNEVTSFQTDVGLHCQPSLRGLTITPQTTYAQLKERGAWGDYVASCLTDCGNAADPTIDLTYPGSRATAFIGVTYSGGYRQVSTALDLWEKAVRRQQGLKEFDLPENYDAFSCVSKPPREVASLLGRVKVTSIRVSREVNKVC